MKGDSKMKKGDRIYIRENAEKPPVRLNGWSEQNLYGHITLPAGKEIYHISMHYKLAAFAPVETCFSETPCLDGYVYVFKLKKDLIFEHIDNNEYRINLAALTNNDVEITYVGTRRTSHKYYVEDRVGNVVWTHDQHRFCEKYKELEKKLNAESISYLKKLAKEKAYLGYKLVKQRDEL